MAKFLVKLTKKSFNLKTVKAAAAGPVVGFNLQDNGDLTFTVFGTDAAGAQVDLSSVATLTATSDAPAVVTVDSPVGMGSAIHAAVPAPTVGATANITLTVTWTNPTGAPAGSPFSIVWPQTIIAGPVTGITVQPGTPSVH